MATHKLRHLPPALPLYRAISQAAEAAPGSPNDWDVTLHPPAIVLQLGDCTSSSCRRMASTFSPDHGNAAPATSSSTSSPSPTSSSTSHYSHTTVDDTVDNTNYGALPDLTSLRSHPPPSPSSYDKAADAASYAFTTLTSYASMGLNTVSSYVTTPSQAHVQHDQPSASEQRNLQRSPSTPGSVTYDPYISHHSPSSTATTASPGSHTLSPLFRYHSPQQQKPQQYSTRLPIIDLERSALLPSHHTAHSQAAPANHSTAEQAEVLLSTVQPDAWSTLASWNNSWFVHLVTPIQTGSVFALPSRLTNYCSSTLQSTLGLKLPSVLTTAASSLQTAASDKSILNIPPGNSLKADVMRGLRLWALERRGYQIPHAWVLDSIQLPQHTSRRSSRSAATTTELIDVDQHLSSTVHRCAVDTQNQLSEVEQESISGVDLENDAYQILQQWITSSLIVRVDVSGQLRLDLQQALHQWQQERLLRYQHRQEQTSKSPTNQLPSVQ